MVQSWTFLIGEIWTLILCAGLLGLGSGWLIFSKRRRVVVNTSEVDRYEKALQLERSRNASLVEKIQSERTRFASMEKVFSDAIKANDEAQVELANSKSLLKEREAAISELRKRAKGSMTAVSSRDGVVPLVQSIAVDDKSARATAEANK